MTMTQKTRMLWTFAISSIALFMVTLDNLVVTTAIPVIRKDLHASLSSLEWTVNAYTLTFAVLLLTGAALGDRFGRRRVFALGIAVFTLGSIAAALAPSVEVLNVARAVQGLGGAIVLPLTLTILSAAVPAERRGIALGAWGGISGLAVAFGPLVGGAVVQGISWHWIFWLNVPIGLVLLPLALSRLQESYGPEGGLDLGGLGLASVGLFGIVWGLIRGNEQGWASTEIVAALAIGFAFVAAFVAWELRVENPMLPMRFFRNATFALANLASLFMYFGMFGSIFLLAQFFQTIQGYSPVRIRPEDPAVDAGADVHRADRGRAVGQDPAGPDRRRRARTAGRARSPGSRRCRRRTSPYSHLIAPFAIAGIGMALFFAPVANIVLSAVKPVEEGKASGANNAIRELGGVFGVAVLASIFAHAGGYRTPETFSHGMNTAVFVGAAVVALGALAAFAIPRGRRRQEPAAGAVEPAFAAEAA